MSAVAYAAVYVVVGLLAATLADYWMYRGWADSLTPPWRTVLVVCWLPLLLFLAGSCVVACWRYRKH